MKLKHHVPIRLLKAEPVSPAYQAEVDRSTERAAAKYEAAARRLARAEFRLQQARDKAACASRQGRGKAQRTIAVALELVEIRRAELQAIEALMKAVPASAAHRGRDSYRPIPQPGSGI